MQPKGWIFLKVLLNKYHPMGAEAVLQALPKEHQSILSVENKQITANCPEKGIPHPIKSIEKIHYSWLAPLVLNSPEPLLPAIVNIFPPKTREKLKRYLNIPTLPKIKPAESIKTMFLYKICAALKQTEILPYDFLPETPLKPLGNWSKEELVELLYILGVYDLVGEVRQIIDKTTVQKLYKVLSLSQSKFLRNCLHQKEKIVSPPLGIKNWDGDKKKLQNLLLERGLMRLGKSLHGEHPDLVWIITHTLDSGRGKLLSRIYAKDSTVITHALQQQTIAAMKFLLEHKEGISSE